MTEMTEKDLYDNIAFEAKSITTDEHRYDNKWVGKNEEETSRGKRDLLSCLWGWEPSRVLVAEVTSVLRVMRGLQKFKPTLQSALMKIFKFIEIFRWTSEFTQTRSFYYFLESHVLYKG